MHTGVAHPSPPNHWLVLGAGLFAGMFLYQSFVVVLTGHLAAVAVPEQYFLWFGKPHQALALSILDLAIAVPVFVLVSGAVLVVCRGLKSRSKPLLASVLVGMFLCYIYGAVSFLVFVPAGMPAEFKPYPTAVRLQQLIYPPWWSLPTLIAPWFGFGFAAWLLRRRVEA